SPPAASACSAHPLAHRDYFHRRSLPRRRLSARTDRAGTAKRFRNRRHDPPVVQRGPGGPPRSAARRPRSALPCIQGLSRPSYPSTRSLTPITEMPVAEDPNLQTEDPATQPVVVTLPDDLLPQVKPVVDDEKKRRITTPPDGPGARFRDDETIDD